MFRINVNIAQHIPLCLALLYIIYLLADRNVQIATIWERVLNANISSKMEWTIIIYSSVSHACTLTIPAQHCFIIGNV